MWGQPPQPALSEAEGAVRRAKLDLVLTLRKPEAEAKSRKPATSPPPAPTLPAQSKKD
jgi:hypothetical protein